MVTRFSAVLSMLVRDSYYKCLAMRRKVNEKATETEDATEISCRKKKTFCFFMLLPSCRVRGSVFMGSLMPQNVEFDILVGKEKNIYLKDRSLVLIPRTGEYQANIK